MTLHLSLPGAHHRSSNNQQQEELREARRVLKEKIRNDWEYPTLPAYRSSGEAAARKAKDGEDEEEKIAGFRFHAPRTSASRSEEEGQQILGLDFDPMEWREREEASETEGEANSVTSTPKRNSKDSKTAYQFEGPDSVATQLAERRSARKRKRKEALREEMQWNKGLELWVHRRDTWCCARPATEVRLAERKALEHQQQQQQQTTTTTTTTEPLSASSTPRTSTSSSTTYQHSASTPATSPSATPDVLPSQQQQEPEPIHLLLPLAPPLLPNHPIRKRITPTSYPEIYSKIILQSRTPSVPINLSTLVKALVQGWKDDGEWPPKPSGPLEPSVGRKKGSAGHEGGGGLRGGLKRVLRVVGEGGRGKEG